MQLSSCDRSYDEGCHNPKNGYKKLSPETATKTMRGMTQDYTSTAVTDKAISRARHLLGKADKLYREGNYCDCLFKIEESIESVDDEPLS
jgi:hypothetical protein